jgi:hypothetical protein
MQFNGLIFYLFGWQQVGWKQFVCSYQTNSFVLGNSESHPHETGETLNGPEIVTFNIFILNNL